ncbi:hypothetical protein [Lentibacillus amyloliquefaciens]|uniref:Uncharacterized protein n=1 Tax=Lentibacillus amyloliquefaciens TaxID=1472767 RepID=A0A0U4EZG0_9BACI|nr:hypothetical protein [Lentibacillus amyloliquefaciens]ALX48647.1 hypothetical protein AOX59_08510 [Lentibacillus amyloliquefaciens]
MVFYVENCFHWVGFHIVNHLLEEGYSVDGTDDINTDTKEVLSMFVGRNELFRQLEPGQREREYEAAICISDDALMLEMDRSVTINLPLVFGEWMPMNHNGFFSREEFIRFDSHQFKREAIYIGEFLNSLRQWIQTSELPSIMDVRSYNDARNKNIDYENSVYIRTAHPLDKYVEAVKMHYEKYKKFYRMS